MNLEELAQVFEAVRVMSLRPSDVLVFKTSRPVSANNAEVIKHLIAEQTGHDNVLVLDSTSDLAVLRPEPEPGLLRRLKEKYLG